MRLNTKFRKKFVFVVAGTLVLFLFSACAGTPPSAPADNTPVAESQSNPTNGSQPESTGASGESSAGALAEIVVYASDLQQDDLFELDFYDDPASPGGKFLSLPNNGDELDPPPENDPHVSFDVQVQSGIPYRCWIHLKVGTPKGRSQANTLWVQVADAVDSVGQEILEPGSGSYLTAQGPAQEGWTWVGCSHEGSDADSLINFRTGGQVKVRIQAGSEGVGFDQFLLSAKEFLDSPPSEAIVEK